MMNPLPTSIACTAAAIVNSSQRTTIYMYRVYVTIIFTFTRLLMFTELSPPLVSRASGVRLARETTLPPPPPPPPPQGELVARIIATTSTICSYLTFPPSACTIAGRSSHDISCSSALSLGTIPFNAHHLRVYKAKIFTHLTGSQGGAFGNRLGSERGLPINRVACSRRTRAI